MSAFTEKLVVSLKDGNKWILEEPFQYYTDIFPARRIISIKAGFETDFASIPKLFLPFLSYKDKFNKAAVVHDYLYASKQFSRKDADRMFLEGLLVLKIPKWKAYIFYMLVRLFGWYRWNKTKQGGANA